MDSFSFLKYWRRSSSDTAAAAAAVFTIDTSLDSSSSTTTTTTTTIVTASSSDSNEKHQDLDNVDDGDLQDDDGSFFDLEFTLPEDVAADKSGEITENASSENESQGEQQEIVINEDGFRADSTSDTVETIEEADTKFNAFGVLKSATKLGVLMFKLKKCKSNVNEKSIKSEAEEENTNIEKPEQKKCKEKSTNHEKHNFFTVNLKGEEIPVLSLFTRDFSSKGESKKNNAHVENVDSNHCSSPDKKIGKDVVYKYLKKVKPLYIRVSKRYGEKLGFSLQLTEPEKTVSPKAAGETVAAGVEQSNVKSLKQVNLQAGLRLVYKQLGKSQSASSATVSAIPAAPAALSRRDDSQLQHEDGIQSAILHCKRSFNASQRYEGTHLQE